MGAFFPSSLTIRWLINRIKNEAGGCLPALGLTDSQGFGRGPESIIITWAVTVFYLRLFDFYHFCPFGSTPQLLSSHPPLSSTPSDAHLSTRFTFGSAARNALSCVGSNKVMSELIHPGGPPTKSLSQHSSWLLLCLLLSSSAAQRQTTWTCAERVRQESFSTCVMTN